VDGLHDQGTMLGKESPPRQHSPNTSSPGNDLNPRKREGELQELADMRSPKRHKESRSEHSWRRSEQDSPAGKLWPVRVAAELQLAEKVVGKWKPASAPSNTRGFYVNYKQKNLLVCKEFLRHAIKSKDGPGNLDIICRPWAPVKESANPVQAERPTMHRDGKLSRLIDGSVMVSLKILQVSLSGDSCLM
jgi:hypothetical protein